MACRIQSTRTGTLHSGRPFVASLPGACILGPWERVMGLALTFAPLAPPSGIGDPENGAKLKLAARQSIEQ